MIYLYGSRPGWTVPCLGPMTTKVAYYLTLSGIPFEFRTTDLAQLDHNSPNGKIPFIDDEGKRIADSLLIMEHLRRRFGDPLGEGVTPRERGAMLAFNRLIDEHLYWIAVIQPRYVADSDWQYYLRLIAGTDTISADLQAFGDGWRARVLKGYESGGWTRLPADVLYGRARQDIDALSDYLGDRPFFMGDRVRWIDASVLSMLRHVIDAPFNFDTRQYAGEKRNLVAYIERMNNQYGI